MVFLELGLSLMIYQLIANQRDFEAQELEAKPRQEDQHVWGPDDEQESGRVIAESRYYFRGLTQLIDESANFYLGTSDDSIICEDGNHDIGGNGLEEQAPPGRQLTNTPVEVEDSAVMEVQQSSDMVAEHGAFLSE